MSAIRFMMQPRWEVIKDFPLSKVMLKHIFYEQICNPTQKADVKINLDEFPHLFNKLQWWEKRTEPQLRQIKYVKAIGTLYKGEIHRVLEYTAGCFGYMSGVRDAFVGDFRTYEGASGLRDLKWFEPATEEEYLKRKGEILLKNDNDCPYVYPKHYEGLEKEIPLYYFTEHYKKVKL